MKKLLLIILIIVVVFGFYGFSVYNRLVSGNENIDTQWAQVETQYQRRFDLVPNLVASVKGILTQEQEVFTAIADARTRYAGAQSVDEKAAAATQVESALGRLLVIVENYPALRSVEAVTSLMTQLEGTENRVSVERRRYNEEVRVYNLMVKRVPSSLVASLTGFEERSYFDAVEGSEVAPAVNLDLEKDPS